MKVSAENVKRAERRRLMLELIDCNEAYTPWRDSREDYLAGYKVIADKIKVLDEN